MKYAAALLTALFAFNAQATTTIITCAQNGFSVTATVEGQKAPYTVTKNGAEVATGTFDVLAAGKDDFLQMMVIALVDSKNNMLGVGIGGLENELKPGVYPEAKSDLLIDTSAGLFDGNTVDCDVIVVK